MVATQPIEIYLSCSQEDHELGRKLKQHLGVLERDGEVTVWQNWDISPGEERVDEMEKHLNSASIILLLISPSFFSSQEQSEVEEPQAIKKHKARETCVIPVILRPIIWESTQLRNLQALPRNGKAITLWPDQDQAFKEVADEIRNAIQKKSGVIRLPQKTKRPFNITWTSLGTTLSTSIVITTLVVVTRLSGVLEPVELPFFDQMMRFKLSEKQDERLLLIQITREDFTKFGSGAVNSLPDKVIYDLLSTLIKKQPKAIGFDLYREQAAKKGSDLERILKETHNLYAVCKVADPKSHEEGNSPPPIVPLERIGFSDLVEDPGDVVRRQILYMGIGDIKGNQCGGEEKSMDSFSFKLAQHYLRTIKKEYKNTKDGNLASGDVVLKRLHDSTSGGYRNTARIKGYQVLLNYRSVCVNDGSNIPECSPQKIAPEFKVQDVIEYGNNNSKQNLVDKLKKNQVKDKIVLIGVKRIAGGDSSSSTPFSLGVKNEPQLQGLIMQAQMVSQLVSAALEEKRPLLQVWSIWYEMPWILFWSLTGGILAEFFYISRPRNLIKNLILFGAIALASLYFVCWIFFTQIMFWIPLVPAALSFLGTGGVIIFIRFRLQKFS